MTTSGLRPNGADRIKLSVEMLQLQVARLLDAYQIIARPIKSTNGRACHGTRTVWIPPIRSKVTYAVALHEIGHIVGKEQGATRLKAEAGAWRWAIDNCMPETADAVRKQASVALRSYFNWAIRRNNYQVFDLKPEWATSGYVQYGDHWISDDPPRVGCPTLPPPDHHFWTLLSGHR